MKYFVMIQQILAFKCVAQLALIFLRENVFRIKDSRMDLGGYQRLQKMLKKKEMPEFCIQQFQTQIAHHFKTKYQLIEYFQMGGWV